MKTTKNNIRKEAIPLERKHGLKARRKLAISAMCRDLTKAASAAKPVIRLTFESRTQSYLWVHDRRTRLIKH